MTQLSKHKIRAHNRKCLFPHEFSITSDQNFFKKIVFYNPLVCKLIWGSLKSTLVWALLNKSRAKRIRLPIVLCAVCALWRHERCSMLDQFHLSSFCSTNMCVLWRLKWFCRFCVKNVQNTRLCQNLDSLSTHRKLQDWTHFKFLA